MSYPSLHPFDSCSVVNPPFMPPIHAQGTQSDYNACPQYIAITACLLVLSWTHNYLGGVPCHPKFTAWVSFGVLGQGGWAALGHLAPTSSM
mmetsp:Transcript_11349/g.20462  ORF Transcript_11349/g.20462 Transcript_11349/m.20462 type:complete len:91 (-) Transcript_11349:814-1086(-)